MSVLDRELIEEQRYYLRYRGEYYVLVNEKEKEEIMDFDGAITNQPRRYIEAERKLIYFDFGYGIGGKVLKTGIVWKDSMG